jgi:hypothetical protein
MHRIIAYFHVLSDIRTQGSCARALDPLDDTTRLIAAAVTGIYLVLHVSQVMRVMSARGLNAKYSD